MSSLRNCTVDGCKKQAFKQGYCGDHYREISGQKPSSAAGGISIGTSNPSCTKCSKVVYPEEQMRSGASGDDGKPCVYHKACFRCSECNFSLELTNVAPERATLYCRKCYENRHVKGTTVAFTAKASSSSGPSVTIETKRDVCTKCNTTVYPSDLVRSGATDDDGKPCLFHKACFRCSVCNTSLELHTSAPEGATLYCRQHYEERHVKGSTAPVKTKGTSAGPSITVETKRDACTKCGKTVYATELVRSGATDDDGKPCLFHKACFRCSVCDTSLELHTSAPEGATLYCRQHYEERHVKGSVAPVKTKGTSAGPSITLSTQRDACTKCGKTVYATELVRSGATDDDGKPCLFHKACFRCSVCDTSLELHTSAPEGATLYCRQHYEERHVKGSAAPLKTKAGPTSGPSITVDTKRDICTKCGTTVYATELVRSGATDEKGQQCLYHKSCFKCSVCNTALELHTCAPEGKILYCTNHYKEIHISRHDQTGALAAAKPSA